MPTNHKATWSKRQREQDQKDRAAERIARRRDRKERAAARAASGQVGPQIAEPEPLETEIVRAVDPNEEAAAEEPGAPGRPPTAPIAVRPPLRRREPANCRIYVGNLSFDTDDAALRELFARFGEITDVHVVMDHVSRAPRGFAFVTMGSPDGAREAISKLDGQVFDGRPLRVNEAEAREASRGGDRRGAGRDRF